MTLGWLLTAACINSGRSQSPTEGLSSFGGVAKSRMNPGGNRFSILLVADLMLYPQGWRPSTVSNAYHLPEGNPRTRPRSTTERPRPAVSSSPSYQTPVRGPEYPTIKRPLQIPAIRAASTRLSCRSQCAFPPHV